MTKATLTKESVYLGLAYRFRGSVHYSHGGLGGGSVLAGMVLEEESGALHLDPKAAEGDCVSHWA